MRNYGKSVKGKLIEGMVYTFSRSKPDVNAVRNDEELLSRLIAELRS